MLGRQLQPFSAFHALALSSVESPFWAGGDPTVDDLVMAVHICSLSWDRRHEIFPDVKQMKRWGRACRKERFDEHMALFTQYLGESNVYPERWQEGGSSEIKACSFYHLVVFGMKRLGMMEAEAWDCPMSRLVCYSEAHNEQETGKSNLISDEERKGIEVLKAEQHGS